MTYRYDTTRLVPVVWKESCSSEETKDSSQEEKKKTDGEESIPGSVPRVREATGMEKIQVLAKKY